jgi:hypothetical protein
LIVKGTAKEMKKSLAHLPEYKQNELEKLTPCVKKTARSKRKNM